MMKTFRLLLFVWLLSLTLSCTRDKNPISADFPVISPDGKIIYECETNLYLDPNGRLWSWGLNLSGQAGQGTTNPVEGPTPINTINHVIDFDTYQGVCLAADADGNLWKWGYWYPTSFYYEPVWTPKIIANLPGVISIGSYLLCDNSTVWKMDSFSLIMQRSQIPEQVPGIDNIKSISGSLAINQNGELKSLADPPTPVEWGGYITMDQISQLQKGAKHCVVLKTDGTVWAWGQNDIGALGDGTNTHSAVPVRVTGLDHVVQISADASSNLALKDDGSVWYWGNTGIRDENEKYIGIQTLEHIETNGPVAYIHAGFDCMLIQKDGTLWTFNIKDRVVHKIDL